jgi:hypothetical protein
MIVRFLMLSILIFSFQKVFGNEFSEIDTRSRNVPSGLRTYQDIAQHLTRDLESEKQKVRAIFIWVSHNIRYDLKMVNSGKTYFSDDEIIKEVMSRRQGVCSHYAVLFDAMCRSVGLDSFVIEGFVRHPDGRFPPGGHAWNAVILGQDLLLIDATWAAGHVINNRYVHQFDDRFFLVAPQHFIETHMPFDPIWQFLDNPVTNKEFISQDFSRIFTPGSFNYRDSIITYFEMDEVDRLEAVNRRINASGIANQIIRSEIEKNQLQIFNLRFNAAIRIFNEGVNNLNHYNTYKRESFRGQKAREVNELLDLAINSNNQAREIVMSLNSKDSGLNKRIQELRRRTAEVERQLRQEKDFVAKRFR